MALVIRLLLLVSLAIAPALCVVAYNEYDLRQARQAELRSIAERSASRAATDVRHLVNEVERISAVIAKLTEVRSAALTDVISEPCSHLLTSLRREYPGQLEFGVANRLGVIVCTTRGARSLRQVEGAQFRRALDSNAFVVGGYGKSQTTDALYLTFAYPIRDDAGAAVGAVLTGMDLGWLGDQLRAFAGPNQSVLSVHDRDLVFLARVPDEAGLIGQKPPTQVQALSAFANKGAIEAIGADGRTRIGAILSMTLGRDAPEKPDLSVAFGLSRDAAFAEINTATMRTIALLVLSLALAVLAAWYGGRRFIRRPIQQLLAAAARWREGDYGARVDLPERSSELGRLATAFEEMAGALGRRERDQRMLINELNHRVKNTLATVQSIASQSLRNTADPTQAHFNFEARLLALSRTHNVLTREKWESAAILEIVSQSRAASALPRRARAAAVVDAGCLFPPRLAPREEQVQMSDFDVAHYPSLRGSVQQ